MKGGVAVLLLMLLMMTALSGRTVAAAEAAPFRWSAAVEGRELAVTVQVAPDCYLYAAQTQLTARDGAGRRLEGWQPPPPVLHPDELSGQEEAIYTAGRHVWRLTLPEKTPLPCRVEVDFQGCRSRTARQNAVCFMPESRALEAGGAETAPPAEGAERGPAVAGTATLPDFRVAAKTEGLLSPAEFVAFLTGASQGVPAAGQSWADRGVLVVLLLALLGGMGLNLTPCVLPMIPVNLAILGAEGGGWRTGMWRASIYGAGMATAYGVLGAAAVLTGARFGTLNSSSWFNWGIAVLFLVLALAMFGVFNLDFSGWSAKFDPARRRWGRLATAFSLGAVAALLAGACVAPVLIAVILLSAEWYAAGRPAGLLLPFVLGLGMALPWPLAGAGMAVLPKPGAWMVRVKQVFGGLILAAALYYGYLGWTLLPGSFQPEAEFEALRNALQEGARSNRPVLIEFGASWCKNCREMERNVLPDPAVRRELERFVTVKFRAEKLSDPAVRRLLDRLSIAGLPAFVVAEPAGVETR